MNRRQFLKRIGLGTAAVVVIPSVLIGAEATAQVVTDTSIIGTDGLFAQIQKGNVHTYKPITKTELEAVVNDVFSQQPKEREFKLYGNRKMMIEIDKAFKKQSNIWWT